MESTRSTRDRFGWVPFPDLLLNVTVFGPMTSPCWNNWCSKARSDISHASYPKLSHISLPILLSSSDSSCQCAGGHMTRAALQALPGAAQGLVKKYVDKRGQRRHCGVKDRLRSSQFFDFINDKIETVMCCYKNKSVSKVVYASVCPSHCPIGHSRSPGMGMVQVEIKHVSKESCTDLYYVYIYIYICAVWFGEI